MSKLTNIELIARVEELEATLNTVLTRLDGLENRQPVTTRNRGPKSDRKMTEFDAWRIMFGDLKSTAVKDVAEMLSLSRGQVYSVRGGYTFKYVKPDQEFEGTNSIIDKLEATDQELEDTTDALTEAPIEDAVNA